MASPIDSLIQKYNAKTVNDFENALKEIIQEITLAGLSRAQFFNKSAFYGGTSLKIFYGLPRFSEDLDFTLLDPKSDFSWSHYFASILELLNSFGFEVEIDEVKKTRDKKVSSVFLKANTKEHLLQIESAKSVAQKVQSNKKINVKCEIDLVPPLGFEIEVKTLFPPMTAAVKVLKSSSLFAGKMHAVLFRKWKHRLKGRDFYDLLWFLGQKIPVKLGYLEQKMQAGALLNSKKILSRDDLMDLLVKRIKSIDWENAKQDVIQFLRDPEEVGPWSSDFFLSAIQVLQCIR